MDSLTDGEDELVHAQDPPCWDPSTEVEFEVTGKTVDEAEREAVRANAARQPRLRYQK